MRGGLFGNVKKLCSRVWIRKARVYTPVASIETKT